MLGVVRVADTGQHIRNGIGDLHEFYLLFQITGPEIDRYRRQGIGEQAISPTC